MEPNIQVVLTDDPNVRVFRQVGEPTPFLNPKLIKLPESSETGKLTVMHHAGATFKFIADLYEVAPKLGIEFRNQELVIRKKEDQDWQELEKVILSVMERTIRGGF